MTLLNDELLEGIRSRAPGYDRDNAFFTEDFDELTAAGYLNALVPERLGGAGLSLEEAVVEQSRLAEYGPATALAVNMHLIWTGVAKTMLDRGDDSLEFVLRESVAGEVFAFGISEPGNELVLFGSTTDAAPQPDGSYSFTGTKIFTSLSPVWTRLGVHGLDASSDDPALIYAFIDRSASGITIPDDWDVLGMRATQSNSTRLDGVRAERDRIVRRVAPGPSGDLLLFSIFANFEVLLSAVYAGIAQRAIDLAIAAAHARVSRATGVARSQEPDTRRRIADAVMELDGIRWQLAAVARDIDDGVDHGDQWYRALSGLKARTTATAQRVVQQAITATGGASFGSSAELARLYRDVLAGGFHPSSDDSAHATIAAAVLGPLEAGPLEESTDED